MVEISRKRGILYLESVEGESVFHEQKFLITRDKSSIYYEIFGEGFPLFLLHGNQGSGRYFSKQIPMLAQFFQLFVVDSRNHGKSSNQSEELSFQLLAEDISEIMLKEKLASADFIGYSDGANILMVFATLFPEKIHRLVLDAGNVAFSDLRLRSKISSLIVVNFFRMLATILPMMKKRQVTTDLMLKDTGLSNDDLQKITAPTLVLVGQHDIVKPEHPKKVSAILPNAHLVVVENQGHRLARTLPKRFNKEVLNFLRE